jgi:AmiR/NasT family two-component response regulator
MESRSIVGQAQGILMQRFQIGSATAFALLRRYSMDTNTRVRDVAEYVIETRDLPADDPLGDDPPAGTP